MNISAYPVKHNWEVFRVLNFIFIQILLRQELQHTETIQYVENVMKF